MATTALSLIATPGKPHSFLAKAAVVEVVEAAAVGGMPTTDYRIRKEDHRIHKRIIRDDKELLDFIAMLIQSGILDN